MSYVIPTLKVKRDGPKGYRIINASAFDPKVHELYEPAEGGAEKVDGKPAKKSAKKPAEGGAE